MKQLFYRLESKDKYCDLPCDNVMMGAYANATEIHVKLFNTDKKEVSDIHPSADTEIPDINDWFTPQHVFGFTSLHQLLRWFNVNNNLHTVADIAKIGVYSTADIVYKSETQAVTDSWELCHEKDIDIGDIV